MAKPERMQKKEFSPFYSREYHTKKTESDERLIFRWLQLLEQRCLLYNVVNKHNCLREDREEKERARHYHVPPKPIVVQPFHSVTNFYGCLVCGKYHICHLKRESCILLVDSLDKRTSCGYSGKLLPIQDNLEVGNFDEDKRTDTEAVYYAMPKYMTVNHNNSGGTKKHFSPSKKKKPHKRQVMDLYTASSIEIGPTKSARLSYNNSPAKKKECRAIVKEFYDLSIESISEEEQQEEAKDEEIAPIVNQDDEMEEEETTVPITIEKYEAGYNPLNVFTKAEEWLISEEKNREEDSYGDDREAEQENVNGEGSHAKNYHNNLRYKNEYYDFLKPVIAKQRKTQREEMDRYDQFIDLYKRDMKEEEPFYVKQDEQEEEKEQELIVERPLSVSVSNKISDEVSHLITALLAIDPLERPLCKIKPAIIHEKLTSYFTTLVRNVTLLVYQSPVLNRLALKRSAKNHNQTTKFQVSTIDLSSVAKPLNDVDYHEFTLCPAKIARALILRLFVTEAYSIMILGYRIQIWGRDQWLRHFPTLIASYHCHTKANGPEGLERLEKEIGDTSTLIMNCLAHYNICPLWLRDRVFNGVD